ncbi:FAD-dependent oxidoreductase [Nonomuraea sp. NEAU-L178]|nr:FAD-dependent oxidoreductase [Nonomuraea aurantiaca]MCA2228402.1 FAD-dependent oxidoreductase [Nonomuraea aurantiaca]
MDVVVIGAGQAGLSSAYFLRRFGFEPLVLDAGDGPGGAWRHRSPSLTMDKVHGIFDLPGVRRFAPLVGASPGAGQADVPGAGQADLPGAGRVDLPGAGRADLSGGDGQRPAAVVVPEYFADYERELGLTVLRPVKVTAVAPGEGGRLVATSGAGEWAARAVVNATGTWTRPYWPYYPGARSFRGRQLHYAAYRGPEEFAGRRVVVVGGGTSAAHVLSEIAGVAASTLWVTRRPPVFRPLDDFGEDARRDAVAMVEARVRAGLPPQSVVAVTGLGYTPIVREALAKGALERLPMFGRVTADGVSWDDGRYVEADTIIWATGFRPALDHLAPLRLREPGGGIKVDGTAVIAEPRLQLVGYGPSASTIGANRAGRTAAQNVRRLLAATPSVPAA